MRNPHVFEGAPLRELEVRAAPRPASPTRGEPQKAWKAASYGCVGFCLMAVLSLISQICSALWCFMRVMSQQTTRTKYILNSVHFSQHATKTVFCAVRPSCRVSRCIPANLKSAQPSCPCRRFDMISIA